MPSTPDQLIDQATRHASHLERLKAGEVKRLRLLLSQIAADLLSMLARDDITAWTRARAEQQIAAIAAMQRARYGRDILPELDKAIIDLAEYEAGFEARSLQAVAPTVTFTLPASTQVLSAVRTNPLTMRGPDGGKLLSTFISELTADQVARTSNAIRAGFAEGQTTVQVMRRLIDDVGPVSERGLSAMVRTALQHVATQAREQTWQANRDIIRGVRWVSTLDSRTSTICRSLDGQVFPIDKGPRPPAHVNCLAGDTQVLTRSPISNVYKRAYEGAAINIRTKAGRAITITPNHPILTRAGWKPAGEINAGDQLACIVEPKILHNHEEDCVEAKFSDLFASVDVTVDPVLVTDRPTTTKDFHGDGTNGEVRIVNVDGLSGFSIRKMLFENGKNSRFVLGESACTSGHAYGSPFFLVHGRNATARRIVSRLCQARYILRRSVIHARLLLLAFVSCSNAAIIKKNPNDARACSDRFGNSCHSDSRIKHLHNVACVNLGYGYPVFTREINAVPDAVAIKNTPCYPGTRNSNGGALSGRHKVYSLPARLVSLFLGIGNLLGGYAFGRKFLVKNSLVYAGEVRALLNGDAGQVEFDSVVECGLVSFSGHVYNLENKENWYLASGIITHNCRSSTVAAIDDRFAFLEKDGTRFARDPETGRVGSVDADTSYYSWLKKQPADVQDSIIGPTRGQLLRNGGLSAQRFAELQLGKNFMPLTLDEMRRLEPVAFSRAGI